MLASFAIRTKAHKPFVPRKEEKRKRKEREGKDQLYRDEGERASVHAAGQLIFIKISIDSISNLIVVAVDAYQ